LKSPALKILPMTPAHVTACNRIVATSDPWKRLQESIDFRSSLRPAGANTRAYVCIAGDEVAGFILFIPEPVFARGGYLRALGVSPSHRRQGIGKKLLRFAEKMTAVRAVHFFLCVSSFNRRAQAFYKKCGYIRAGALPGIIRKGISEYIYWKRLRPLSSNKRRP
jgi:ribosomal-protein-alanine N-acetyltransferase